MIAEHRAVEFDTRGNDHIVDLTAEIQALVADTGVTTGQVALLSHGSTGALTTLGVRARSGEPRHRRGHGTPRSPGRPVRARGDLARRQRPLPRQGLHRRALAGVAGGKWLGPPGHLAADCLHGLRHPASAADRPCECGGGLEPAHFGAGRGESGGVKGVLAGNMGKNARWFRCDPFPRSGSPGFGKLGNHKSVEGNPLTVSLLD